jgi:hypothetical protein
MNNEKWAQYDVARNRLRIMVGHYSELIRDEENKPTPDMNKIEQWEDLQHELSEKESLLSADDVSDIALINETYGPLTQAIMKG